MPTLRDVESRRIVLNVGYGAQQNGRVGELKARAANGRMILNNSDGRYSLGGDISRARLASENALRIESKIEPSWDLFAEDFIGTGPPPPPPPVTRTLTITAGANGQVSPAPGQHDYSDGEVVTVTATPASGYQLAAWTGAYTGSALTFDLTMDADKIVGVTFEAVPPPPVTTYTLTITAGANGAVAPAPGVHTYAEGEVVTITAAPDSGYQLDEWTGDYTGDALSFDLTMDADKTVGVTFEAVPVTTYTLTITAGPNGAVAPVAGVHTYDDDGDVVTTDGHARILATSSPHGREHIRAAPSLSISRWTPIRRWGSPLRPCPWA